MVLVVAGVFLAMVWAGIEELDFDPEAAEALLESSNTTADPDFFASDEVFDDIVTTTTTLDLELPNTTVSPEPAVPATVTTTTTTVPELPPPQRSGGTGLTGYLIGASDNAPSIGAADTIYLAVKGSGTVLYAVPRSLYVENPCTGQGVRVALLLRGCPGVASGPSLLALGLSKFTGVSIAGFATVSYSGFVEIADALGGVTVCSDTPRGVNGTVIVPEGCNLLGGSAAAWWARARAQDEFVDGEWRAVSGDDVEQVGAPVGVAQGSDIACALLLVCRVTGLSGQSGAGDLRSGRHLDQRGCQSGYVDAERVPHRRNPHRAANNSRQHLGSLSERVVRCDNVTQRPVVGAEETQETFWYSTRLLYNAASTAEVAQLARAQPCQG